MVVFIITRHGNTRKCEKPSYMMSQLNWKSFLSLNAVTQERHACCRFESYWHQSFSENLYNTSVLLSGDRNGLQNRKIWVQPDLSGLDTLQGCQIVMQICGIHRFSIDQYRECMMQFCTLFYAVFSIEYTISKQNEFTPVFIFVIINM